MSKQKNTLLNYFQSPKANVANSPKTSTPSSSKKVDSDEEIITSKRNRSQVIDSSDSEDESPKPINKKQKSQKHSSSSENENSTPNTPKNAPKKSRKSTSHQDVFKMSQTFDSGKGKKKEASKFQKKKEELISHISKTTNINPNVAEGNIDIHSHWLHNRLEFLQPENIRDANKRERDHPEYDPKTLYVPESYIRDLTPAMQQWWQLKSQHMDSILFFKVGKFYELYHMDAVIGVKELGFMYMKGDFAHSGFPEAAYEKMAKILLQAGYKIARCEQTETPDMMKERCKKQKSTSKVDKVVKREICQVSVKGSTIYTAQLPEPLNEEANHMYAISTTPLEAGNIRIGVCFVETSLGKFYLSEFDDDKHFSILLALMAEYPAALILTERKTSTKILSDILSTNFADVRKESLLSNQFYSASKTLEELASECYFKDKDGRFEWPEFFKQVADDCIPKRHAELALSSLGACLWHLKNSQIDIQVFTMSTFQWHNPLNLTSHVTNREYMILDAMTIKNLNLLSTEDSLQTTIDHCETSFGKRLLHRWICRPLCDVVKITERQKAVSALVNDADLLKNAKKTLEKIPDLERLLTKIHTYGSRSLPKKHPDSRAILYEEQKYSKKKIKDFVKTIRAFEKLQQIPSIFKDCDEWLLKKITLCEPDGKNCDLREILDDLKTKFNLEEAEKEGKIIPGRGVITDFDEAEDAIEECKKKLDEYLEEQSKMFGCKIKYSFSDRNRYQIEVPENRCHKAPKEYHVEGLINKTKDANRTRRYTTPTSKELLADLVKAEAERTKVILGLNKQIFGTLNEQYEKFYQVIQCTAFLDVLCSLAEFARTFSQDICMPDILPFSDKPHIIIENGRHPCNRKIDSFVPNDTKLGVENYPSVLILTGANMGGKSTLMRQILVIAVMAQIGSFVPASSCQLTVVDRVFTRIGARDDIVQGQSTFHVELSEAGSILQHATKHSLVLVDEFGRGTSTHDGNAIATAYLKKLSTIGCRSLFSTHYHSLVDNFIERDDMQLGYMACLVENDDDPDDETVTFLYKMAHGKCPKSYGFNVAKLAGVNKNVIKKGREIAAAFEWEANLRLVFSTIFTTDNLTKVRRSLASLNL